MINADRTVDTTVIVTPLPTDVFHIKASITGPTIVAGANLTIAARPKPQSSDVLGYFAFIKYSVPFSPVPPVPQINPTSYYDMQSEEAKLTLNFTTKAPINLMFIAQLRPTSGPLPDPMKAVQASFDVTNFATIALPVDMATACTTAAISVASLDPFSGKQSSFSDEWHFPKIPDSFLPCFPIAKFTSAGSVQASWSWSRAPDATEQFVVMTLFVPNAITVRTRVQKPDAVATFTMAQSLEQIAPGLEVEIQCTSIAPGLASGVAKITFIIPGSDGWTPYSVVNTETIGNSSTITSLVQAGVNNVELWWAGEDGSIQTAMLQGSNWTGSQFMSPSTVPRFGSCLTSTSRNDSHKEVWWIAENGAIDGRFRLDDGQGWRQAGTGPELRIPSPILGRLPVKLEDP